jgi:hypothetical protein|tara:strand:- start:614 stop:1657 length:1044 start_codon:yes stop_codon:yes gene_type:complete
MSAYKKLNKEDSFLTSYTAHKRFTVTGSQHDEYGVETYIGISSPTAFFPATADKRLVGTDREHYTQLVYDSIKHLYYSGFENGSPVSSSNDMSGSAYENYLQSSYTQNQRRAESEFTIISIPQNLYGTNIKPGSVRIEPDIEGSGSNYAFTSSDVGGNFVSESYNEEIDTLYGAAEELQDGEYVVNEGEYVNETQDEFVVAGFDDWKTTLVDDKNGNLILSASSPQRIVGNVIYSHGLMVITNPAIGNYYANYFSGSVTWQSSQPIYTYNYHCPIGESEFNNTLHPTSVTGSDGTIKAELTGSHFKPYFTTVGLYNDANELIAVAKMGQPVPVSNNNETTVVVKLDI